RGRSTPARAHPPPPSARYNAAPSGAPGDLDARRPYLPLGAPWCTRDAKQTHLLTGLHRAQIGPYTPMDERAIHELAIKVFAQNQELAALQSHQNLELVTLGVSRRPGFEGHHAVAMPRCAIEPDEGVLVLDHVDERENHAL